MGSQNRLSLTATGPSVAHYPTHVIEPLKSTLDSPPTEAGQQISAKLLVSLLISSNPFLASIFSAISILLLIQKIFHYAEIAETQGTDAAVFAIMKDIADGAIREYITDSAMESLIDSGNVDPALRAQIEEIVGMVVDQSIDQIEEAFLND
ncbi:MAG: hypothetical protein WC626_07810 [Methanoregula sp.]